MTPCGSRCWGPWTYGARTEAASESGGRDPEGAARLLRTALELWRGPALLDVAAASLAVRGGPDHSRADAARVEAAARAALGDAYEECFTAVVRDGDGPVGLETVRELARVTLAG
ncbi:hypothetical protein OG444_20520 [Streptomyces sp. NBC_01232]|uniref:BTAD domain-containing putative transcriptional regulator n=1 Tax=Streptomyces sp. NBC_01232 TaxID=2903786 RepID=UPI002E10F8F7|nr:hypothetical protein OG444_20520 [Streptomyces sp. NBC_01232]